MATIGDDGVEYGDGMSDAAQEYSLPPHYQVMYERALGEIVSGMAEALEQIEESVASAEAGLGNERANTIAIVSEAIGAADSDLRTVATPVMRAIERAITETRRALIFAEEEMRAEGVAVPYTVDQRIVDLADATGQAIVDRLTGIRAQEWGTVAVGVPDASTSVDTSAVAPGVPGAPGAVAVPIEPPVVTDEPVHTTIPVPPPPPPLPPIATLPTIPPLIPGLPPVPIIPLPDPSSPVSPPPPPPPPPSECGCPVPPPACPAPVITVTCPPVASPPPPPPSDDDGDSGDGSPPSLPPPPPPDVADVDYTYHGLSWSLPTVCRDVQEWIRRERTGPLTMGAGQAGEVGQTITDWYRGAVAQGRGLIEYVTSGFDEAAYREAVVGAYRTVGDVLGGTSLARTALDFVPSELVPERPLWWALAYSVGAAHKASQETGIPVHLAMLPVEYVLNSMSAHQIPAPQELDAMRRGGQIDAQRWACLQRAHAVNTDLRELLYTATLPAPSPVEIESWRLRGILPDELVPELYARHGITEPWLRSAYALSARYVVPPSDLVRFMKREVFDEDIVRAAGYDEGFAEAWVRDGKRMGEAVGIDDATMRYYWRADWNIPSRTQLDEMRQRLRADRPEVEQWQREFALHEGDPEWLAAHPMPITVSAEDVRRAYVIDDVAPRWIDALMAVGYKPINTTTAVDAYHAQVFTDESLYHAFRDVGYNEPDARLRVTIERAKKGRRIANLSGVWTVRQILTAYQRGEIDSMQADMLMTPLVLDGGERQTLLAGADQLISSKVRGAHIKRIRRGYYVGEYDALAASAMLQDAGVRAPRVQQLVDWWTHEKLGRYREPSARQIVQWGTLGLITVDDAVRRLGHLGYSLVDSQRIAMQGIIGQVERIEARADKVKKEIERSVKDQRQAARESEKALRDRLKEIEKQQEKWKKEQERIQKELDKRA